MTSRARLDGAYIVPKVFFEEGIRLKLSSMKNCFFAFLILLTTALPLSALSEGSAERRPALSFGLELGGPSIIYAFTVDWNITPELRPGIGYSAINQADFVLFEFRDYEALPLTLDYTFFRRGGNSFYLSSGVTFFRGGLGAGGLFDELFGPGGASSTSRFSGFFIPVGIGWEYRARNGFNVRVSDYMGFMSATSEGVRASEFVPPYFFSVTVGWAFF